MNNNPVLNNVAARKWVAGSHRWGLASKYLWVFFITFIMWVVLDKGNYTTPYYLFVSMCLAVWAFAILINHYKIIGKKTEQFIQAAKKTQKEEKTKNEEAKRIMSKIHNLTTSKKAISFEIEGCAIEFPLVSRGEVYHVPTYYDINKKHYHVDKYGIKIDEVVIDDEDTIVELYNKFEKIILEETRKLEEEDEKNTQKINAIIEKVLTSNTDIKNLFTLSSEICFEVEEGKIIIFLEADLCNVEIIKINGQRILDRGTVNKLCKKFRSTIHTAKKEIREKNQLEIEKGNKLAEQVLTF